MTTQRRSVRTSVQRPSAVSIDSDFIEYNEDQRNIIERCFSFIYTHKIDIYRILERQQGNHTLVYHLFVFVLTLFSLVLGSISTIDEWQSTLNTPLYYSELFLCVFFTYEFIIRVWSAGCRPRYRTWVGRLMFVTRSVIVVDILTLIGFAISLSTGITSAEFPISVLKFLPLLQVVRFLRVDRQLSSWAVLKGIIAEHHNELATTIVIGFMFLIIGAYLVFITETPVDPSLNKSNFKSMADSLWFSIITMTTIGFGDLSPTTFIGKMVTTTIIYLGVAFWCLPGGIIGSGLAIKVQEQKRDEAVSSLVPAAASVISNWWRLRCVHNSNHFVATWRIYKLAHRRHPPPISSTTSQESDTEKYPLQQSNRKTNSTRRRSVKSLQDLPRRYVTAIKIIRMLKYSVACTKYYRAKNPVNIKDIVNENTQLNSRLTSLLNEIQRRLDHTLGTKKISNYLSDHEKQQYSLSSRIESAERLANVLETRLNHLEDLAKSLYAMK